MEEKTNAVEPSEQEPFAERYAAPPRNSNVLRNLTFGCGILFFGVLTLAVVLFIVSLNQTKDAIVSPISDLVQQLVVPVTPVILPNPATIVREINDLSRLETSSFEFEKVITAETNTDAFWGALGESMVFVAHGKVFAGVDFADMATNDLQVYDPKTVSIHLPRAKIFDDIPALDNEKSFVADRDTGILTRADPELETKVRQEAERAILEAASQSEILERADYNAQQYMISFMQGLGFENIIFTDSAPEPAPPFEQIVPKGFVVTPASPN